MPGLRTLPLMVTVCRSRIEQIEVALHPVTEIGKPATAGNAGRRRLAEFASPTPSFRLSDAKRAEYAAEVKALKAKLAAPGLRPEVKQRLAQELAKLEHLLGMDAAPTPDHRPFQERRVQG